MQKARDELTYSHNINGEWQVSYHYSTLAIHQNNQVSIQLLVDDYLWDNLTSWLIKVFTLPRLQQCTQHNKSTRGKTGGNRLPDSVHNERAKEYAEYIIEHDATMRKTAEHFYVSKNTVHDEITKTLPHCYPDLFAEVQKVIARNKFERFSRGGKATKRKNNRLNDRVVYKRF